MPFPASFHTEMVQTNGTSLFVRIGGKGPAVLLLHGFGDTGDMWASLAADLVRDHTVIVPDLRGMGLSAHPDSGYTKKNQAVDIAGVMDALKVEKAALVTHDIGNMVGYALAAQSPDRITRWAVIDAPLPGIGNWDTIVRSPLLWHFNFRGPDVERLVPDLDRLYAAVKKERGTLDIVFANAGVGSQLRLGEITAKHIDETFDVNVKGTIFTVQKALALMGKGGSIILTGSSAGTTGAPAFTAYSASKAAVRNLARTWAEDLKGTGIRVNVLTPGAVATELAATALGEEGLKAYGAMTALQRMGDPAELGAAAAFLASSDSSFMTASEVAVDGGLAQL